MVKTKNVASDTRNGNKQSTLIQALKRDRSPEGSDGNRKPSNDCVVFETVATEPRQVQSARALRKFGLASCVPRQIIIPEPAKTKSQLEARSANQKVYVQKTISETVEALACVLNDQPTNRSIHELYCGVESLCRLGKDAVLWKSCVDTVEASLQDWKSSLAVSPCSALTLLEAWHLWKHRTGLICSILLYLDKTSLLLSAGGKPSVAEYFYTQFRRVIVRGTPLHQKALDDVVNIVDIIRRQVLTSATDCSVSPSLTLSKIEEIVSSLDQELLDQLVEFETLQAINSCAQISGQTSIASIAQFEALLRKGHEFEINVLKSWKCDHYKSACSAPRLGMVQCVQARLVHLAGAGLVEEANISGFVSLQSLINEELQLASSSESQEMWQSFFQALKSEFRSATCTLLKHTLNKLDSNNIKLSKIPFKILHKLEFLYSCVRELQLDKFYQAELFSVAHEEFGKVSDLVAQGFAYAVDALIRQEINAVPMRLRDQLSDSAIVMKAICSALGFVSSRDLFRALYARLLSKRLLLDQDNRLLANESQALVLLKQEYGPQFTTQFDVMVKDKVDTMKFCAEFQDLHADIRPSFTPFVLTDGQWPTPSTNVQFKLPQVLEQQQDDFETWFLQRNKGRRLVWRNELGYGTLSATFNAGPKDLHVTLEQCAILNCFNDHDALAMEQLQSITEIEPRRLTRALQSLAHGAYRVLISEPTTNGEILPSHVFRVNLDFDDPASCIKIRSVTTTRANSSKSHLHESALKHVIQDRLMELEATVIRVMKARKQCSRAELIDLVLDLARQRGVTTTKAVDCAIERLVSREFITDTDNSLMYNI